MDNSGSLNAQVIHQLGPGLRSKMAIQVSGSRVGCSPSHLKHWAALTLPPPPRQTQQSKFVNWQVDGEYRGSDFTAAVTLGNPDVLVGSGKRHRALPATALPASPSLLWTSLLPSEKRAGAGEGLKHQTV